MKRILVTLMALAIAGCLALTTQIAQASSPDYKDTQVVMQLMQGLAAAEDYEAAYNALNAEAQDAVDRWVTPVAEETSEHEETVVLDRKSIVMRGVGNPTFPVRCKTKTSKKYNRNAFGVKILTYTSKTRYCYNGRQIVGSPRFTRSGQVHWSAPVWKFDRHLDKSTSWGPNRIYWRDYTKGRFKAKVGPITKYWTASISKTCFGNGR